MTKTVIKETSEFLTFVCRLANTVSSVLEDNKVSILELPQLLLLFPQLVPAVNGAKDIPSELADLDEQELIQLTNLVRQELKLSEKHGDIEFITHQFVFVTFALIKAIHDLAELTKKKEA